jgi:hypothetical protein
MDAQINASERIREALTAALDGTLSDAQAQQLPGIDRDLLTLAWLAAAQRIAELQARLGGQFRTHLSAGGLMAAWQRLAERMIHPAVILRKISQCNRSEKGAAMQAVLMSAYRTLRLQGLDPLATITSALRTHLATSQLPPLPVQSCCRRVKCCTRRSWGR